MKSSGVPLSGGDVYRIMKLINRRMRDIRKSSIRRKGVALHLDRMKEDFQYWEDLLKRLAPFEVPEPGEEDRT